MIPLYIIEEHHEAYYAWYHAVSKGFLPDENNILVHVDHHDDFVCGNYSHDFTVPLKTLEERIHFTYGSLGIATFIVPAIYDRLFDKILNFKSAKTIEAEEKRIVIFAKTPHILDIKKYIPFIHKRYEGNPNSKYRFVDYAELSLEKIYPEKPWVLDIDLDYFYCDDSLSTGKRPLAEITKEEYDRYQSERYHPMKILADRVIEYSEENGKYYLSMNLTSQTGTTADENQIDERLDAFAQWLSNIDLAPAVIDICRSRFSGYCPADKWEKIERGLLERLKKIYTLDLQSLL